MSLKDYNLTLDDIDSMYAYDTGCTDSGVSEPTKRLNFGRFLELDKDSTRVISEYVRDYYLSPKCLDEGYSIVDVRAVIDWL